MRRPTSNTHSMAGKQRSDDFSSARAPINEHGLTETAQGQGTNGRSNFGLQDGLHPLQELDTGETTQTQKEEKETEKHEHEEQQEYYNQYRNPIARFRAQYPQASAEFLAVRVSVVMSYTLLTILDFRISLPWNNSQFVYSDFVGKYR